MWLTIIPIALKRVFGAGDKAIDVRHINKALNRFRADIDEATRDQKVTGAELAKCTGSLIALLAIAFQGARD